MPRQWSLLGRALLGSALLFGLCASCAPAGMISDPTSSWTVITYSSPNQYDYADDQSSGDDSIDITGDSSNPSL